MTQHTKLAPNDRLKRERTLRGWTQGDVAGFIGTDGYTVNRWERGRAVPSPYFRQKLCELFGKNAEELGLLDEQRTRSESPVPAIWNVPYRRNPFFVGRENIFSRLQAALKAGNMTALVQRQALCGLGGIGKTQTAVEYAYRCCGKYSAVLWVQADSRSLLLAEFVRLAGVLNLPEQTEQDTYSIVQAVKCWLQQQTGWLLIFDGVEDVEVVSDFLPPIFQGHVLLTTRIQSTGMVAQRIEIEHMPPEEGLLFLLRRTKLIAPTAPLAAAMETDQRAAGELTRLLDGLPLALDQAAAYIEETACGIAGYISRYHTCRTKLLALRGNVSPSDTQDHPESVVTTLSLSFNKIRQTNKAGLELLSLCAFLHPEAIPEEIFLDGAAELGPILQTAVTDLLSLDGVVSDLRKFSLVHRAPDSNTLTLHRLVQTVIRDGMDEGTQRLWAERAIRAVNRTFPDVEFASWSRCKRLLPQVQTCLALVEQLHVLPVEAARLFDQAGTYLREHAQYEQAEPLYAQSLAIREQASPASPPDIAQALHHLALLYNEQDKYDQAEPLLLRALDICKLIFGSEHVEVAKILNDLAMVYDNQGRFQLSEPLYMQALEIFQRTFGPMHSDTATCLNNLGWLYLAQGKYVQAEPIYQQSLAIRKHLLEPQHPQHPDIAISLNMLGWLYFAVGNYAQAETFLLEALAMRQQNFGPQHPDVAGTLNHLADVYRMQGRYAESESLNREALTIREHALGAGHRDVATCLHSLGRLYMAQGDHEQAEAFFNRALAIREQALGLQHLTIAISLNDLAELYFAQCMYEKAACLNQRAHDILEQTVGLHHPHTSANLHLLAELYRVQGRHAEAGPLYLQAIAIREQCLGANHPDLIKCAQDYAAMLRASHPETVTKIREP